MLQLPLPQQQPQLTGERQRSADKKGWRGGARHGESRQVTAGVECCYSPADLHPCTARSSFGKAPCGRGLYASGIALQPGSIGTGSHRYEPNDTTLSWQYELGPPGPDRYVELPSAGGSNNRNASLPRQESEGNFSLVVDYRSNRYRRFAIGREYAWEGLATEL